MSTLKQIALDLIAGRLILSEAELATERLKVCQECNEFKGFSRQCALCGCFLDLKTRILSEECPISKW